MPDRDPRVFFAAERTLLAWIRTGLGLVGMGFVVAKFGLFFRLLQPGATIHTDDLVMWNDQEDAAVVRACVALQQQGDFALVIDLFERRWLRGGCASYRFVGGCFRVLMCADIRIESPQSWSYEGDGTVLVLVGGTQSAAARLTAMASG